VKLRTILVELRVSFAQRGEERRGEIAGNPIRSDTDTGKR
jgi:hypothetical protein